MVAIQRSRFACRNGRDCGVVRMAWQAPDSFSNGTAGCGTNRGRRGLCLLRLPASSGTRQLDLFMVGPEWPVHVPGSRNTDITDAGFQKLDQLTNLEQLKILTTAITDDSLGTISQMTQLKSLQLDGHPITDDGVAHLQSLKSLEVLHLRDTKIGDESLKTISQLESLRYVDLSGTSITDAGLSRLSALTNLGTLDVTRTEITDDGLASLGPMTWLKLLNVEIDKHITIDGVDKLKSQLPNCMIRCWDMEPDGSGVLAETR